MEKNTGKTESLNYILRKIKDSGKKIAVTSIGIDGESCDQVTGTEKPEIEIYEGMVFLTSEKHYRERLITSEIEHISEYRTALGRLITARAVTTGKVLLSGPSDTEGLKREIEGLQRNGTELVIVDGALSRKSLGSPAVTEAMILATGAAIATTIPELVRKTKYQYDLIHMEVAEESCCDWAEIISGIWAIGGEDELHYLGVSAMVLETTGTQDDIFRYGNRFFITGALGDKIVDVFERKKCKVDLIVKDFTRLFLSPERYYSFIKRGNRIRVLKQSRLLAISINPQSPGGYLLDSDKLQEALQREVDVPVFDVRKRE